MVIFENTTTRSVAKSVMVMDMGGMCKTTKCVTRENNTMNAK